MFVSGMCNPTYATSIQSSLQMLVPDGMRGRVMGFYGMTHNITPLGGMLAGVLADLITAPFAIAVGGLVVAARVMGNEEAFIASTAGWFHWRWTGPA